MSDKKCIALVAHDHRKQALLDWVKKHKALLEKHTLIATGSTGKLIEDSLGVSVQRFESGPLGGDLQIGAKITDGEIDIVIFFWDPLEAQPHDPDVRALLRIAVVWNIPIACNQITADIIINSDFMQNNIPRETPDFSEYRNRRL